MSRPRLFMIVQQSFFQMYYKKQYRYTVLGIKQLPTSGGRPQTDGLVERLNRMLKQMLSKVVCKGGKDWDELLCPILFAYRTAPQTSTRETPFMLVYGRDPRVPTSLDFYHPCTIPAVLCSHRLCQRIEEGNEEGSKCGPQDDKSRIGSPKVPV